MNASEPQAARGGNRHAHEENTRRLLEALSKLPLGLAKRHTAGEVVRKPIFILGDDPKVDVLQAMGGLSYGTAAARAGRAV